MDCFLSRQDRTPGSHRDEGRSPMLRRKKLCHDLHDYIFTVPACSDQASLDSD